MKNYEILRISHDYGKIWISTGYYWQRKDIMRCLKNC